MQETQYFDNIFQMNRTTSKEKYENMEYQLNEFITYIKSQNLSPIEQVMLVYDKAKLFESAGNDTSLETRQLPDVIANGKAVCAGYTNFFNECMTRLGYKNCAIESYIGNVSHMHSLVEINDDKYDIHGIYNFDPTFDSLDMNSPDRTISYAFFGRSVDEVNHLREQRIPRGASIAIMQGVDGKYGEISSEIPTRTMNIVNGFFPSEENSRFIQEHYSELKDRSNWASLNENYLFQISQLGFKIRRAENIPVDTLEEIIKNVRQVENPNLSQNQINIEMTRIKEFNNSKFSEYYSDSRLLFKITPKNYIGKDDYPQVLEQINEVYSKKSSNEKLNTFIEFTNGQQQQATLKVESLMDEEKKILLDYTFDSNYDFVSKLLNPLIRCYAENFPYESSKIGNPEYFNFNIRSYTSNSIAGDSLSIIDGNLDYLQQVDTYVKSNSKKIESQIVRRNDVQIDSNSNDNFFIPPSDDRINQYNEYRAQILPLLSSTDPDAYIHSDFTIGGENGEICRHTLEKMSTDSRQVLSQRDFEYDEVFRMGMLEPSLIDYAKTNPITKGKINTIDNGMSQYMAYSETNSVLTVNNISEEYANYIDQEIKKVDPVIFQQQMEQYQQQVQDTYSFQKTLKNNSGFLSILMLSSIVGFVAGFMTFIICMIIK